MLGIIVETIWHFFDDWILSKGLPMLRILGYFFLLCLMTFIFATPCDSEEKSQSDTSRSDTSQSKSDNNQTEKQKRKEASLSSKEKKGTKKFRPVNNFSKNKYKPNKTNNNQNSKINSQDSPSEKNKSEKNKSKEIKNPKKNIDKNNRENNRNFDKSKNWQKSKYNSGANVNYKLPDLDPLKANRAVFEKSDEEIRPFNEIDRIILKNLESHSIKPALECTDAVFIRRVYIDLIGTIPDPQTVSAFLRDPAKDKRSILIDQLLEEDRFIDYWSMKWCDLLRVKSEFPINLWPNGVAAYHRWIQQALRDNMPYDQFARTLLTSSGSNFRCGPANFYRASQNRDSVSLAEAVGQIFLGFQLGTLPKERQTEMAKFFSRVAYKGSAQWKEEIVYWDRRPLDTPEFVFPDGSKGSLADGQDPRALFADWLIRPQNNAFNQNIVNRIWYWIFRRGIVHEPDDFRPDNPPCCPELLEYLANELVENHYDLKHIYRLIFNSRTWQQSSIPQADYAEAEKYFAVYPVKRIEAEVLQDIFIKIFRLQLTYMNEVPEPYSFLPDRLQTVELSDAGITNSFLEMFGRSTRDTGLESDRNNDVTASQQLFFINSNEINSWVKRTAQQILNNQKNLMKDKTVKYDPVFGMNYIWLLFLSRQPSDMERNYCRQLLINSPNRARAMEDFVWSIVNSKEFLCRH